MNKNRKVIGRTFSSTVLESQASQENVWSVFALSSGRKARFVKITVPADEIEIGTFVVQEINGRDQSSLTPESLRDITRTLKFQQFFPAIGVKREQGIEVLDGSRRRMSALICRTGLDLLVTGDQLTAVEARDLAKDLQTAKEHNIREIGMRLLALKNSGLSQKEIAQKEGLSQAKVTRALQAASVSAELLSLFPVQSEITYADYKVLLAAEEQLTVKNHRVRKFIADINYAVSEVCGDASLAEDEIKNKIVALIRNEAILLVQSPTAEKTVTTSLWNFTDKNRYARKKSRGRKVSYEFNRLPTELQNDIEKNIQLLLLSHLKN